MPEQRLTYHLVPLDRWAAWSRDVPYTTPSLAEEGFIHCTDGVAAMVETANRHYRSAAGAFLVLTVDLARCGSPWRIDDPGKPYPHVYGPIDPAAIVGVVEFPRDPDGTFLAFA